MAKGKKEKSVKAKAKVTPATQPPVVSHKFSFLQYLLFILIFGVLCLLQIGVIKLFTKETIGMWTFFAAIFLGFIIVSMFSWFYDLIYRDEDKEDLT